MLHESIQQNRHSYFPVHDRERDLLPRIAAYSIVLLNHRSCGGGSDSPNDKTRENVLSARGAPSGMGKIFLGL